MYKKALILLHGRGSDGADMELLAGLLKLDGIKLFTPTAINNEWYPNIFNVAKELNLPKLWESLQLVDRMMIQIQEVFKIDPREIILAGFSQGACLAASYAATHPKRYGGVGIFSGGLIGKESEVHEANFSGNLMETPVFIGCDQNDFHIPISRVEQTAKIFTSLNAKVELKLYSDLGHSIHLDEINFLKRMCV